MIEMIMIMINLMTMYQGASPYRSCPCCHLPRSWAVSEPAELPSYFQTSRPVPRWMALTGSGWSSSCRGRMETFPPSVCLAVMQWQHQRCSHWKPSHSLLGNVTVVITANHHTEALLPPPWRILEHTRNFQLRLFLFRSISGSFLWSISVWATAWMVQIKSRWGEYFLPARAVHISQGAWLEN